MSGNGPLVIENAAGTAPQEIFALTDEQILELGPEEAEIQNGSEASDRGDAEKSLTPGGVTYKDEVRAQDGKGAQPGMAVLQEPPGWLAREMKDPWVGDEARELWEGVQRAQREAAAYREAFATPEDAQALKEIYPGGVAEAKSAASRARELAEIDAVFFGAAGRSAEEARAGRVQLVEKLYAQDPAAFREMVEAGVQLLGGTRNGTKVASDEWRVTGGREDLNAETQRMRSSEEKQSQISGAAGASRGHGEAAQAGVPFEAQGKPVPQEAATQYREFERATNAELEKSVGGAIGRAMEAALPNLRQASRGGGNEQTAPLQDRLRAAVREDVEVALRSDASLGEQVARVLSGRRLDEAARAQVVRLIDARAQQLVPGAVRRVVGSWTQATLGARKSEAGLDGAGHSAEERRAERTSSASPKLANGDSSAQRRDQAAAARSGQRGRVDYRKLSDEQILGM